MSLTADSRSADAPAPSPPPAAVLSRLVQLLAEEAPADEIEALIEANSGRSGELVVRAFGDAGRIRSLLDRLARQERDAQALYETARYLTSLRDSDAVLTAIVERTRILLDCDSTYIALVDEASGDAFMRVTSGTRTRPIETVRQRPGYGIGGYVIQSGRPLATANYRTDPRIRRDPQVAEAVAEDGVVAIAGMPIKLGGAVLGALFAANRHERTFDRAEMAMLSWLAAYAAIVIENARLFERLRASVTEVGEANVRLRAQREALERADRVHAQLMPMALTQVGMTEFTTTLARLLEGTVVVVDGRGEVLAAAAVTGAPDPADILDGPARRGVELRDVPVRAGSETFGRLRLGRTQPITDADARSLECAAQTAALLLLMQRQTGMVGQELREELVGDLLAEPVPDWTAFERRAARLGVDLSRDHAVVVVAGLDTARRALANAAYDVATGHGGISGEHAGEVVMLLPDVPAGRAARCAAQELTAILGATVTAGAAGPARSASEARALHRDAARCRRLLAALGRQGHAADIAELGVLGTVLETLPPGRVHEQFERTLRPLLDYDSEHQARLVETVQQYFACGQSPPTAARALGVHVNTVYQRLDRVDQVLGGPAWRCARGALELQVVLHLHRLVEAATPVAG
jgi:GAF domain-containing protein